jgi:hypothetical protein
MKLALRSVACLPLLLTPAAMAQDMSRSSELPAGKYCYANPDSTLTLDVREKGSAGLSLIYSPRDGGHSCGLEGTVKAIKGGWRYSEKTDGRLCRLDILFAGNGKVSVKDHEQICRDSHCGANAWFDGIEFSKRDRKRC